MQIAILGSGFIGRFYAESFVAQRRKDKVVMVYDSDAVKAQQFANDYQVPHYVTDIKEAVSHPHVDVVIVAVQNHMHLEAVLAGAIGEVIWARSRETHPGPYSDWFWDKKKAGGCCMINLGCHCVEISRTFIYKDVRPMEVMCWADTGIHPIDADENAIALVKYANGVIGQFEVSWSFRGGMDLRDELMGTEGPIWFNNFLRTGFEMFTTGKTSACC